MTNLETMTENMVYELKDELSGITKRLDELNADFFKGIFRDVLRDELQTSQRIQAEEVKSHFDSSLLHLSFQLQDLASTSTPNLLLPHPPHASKPLLISV